MPNESRQPGAVSSSEVTASRLTRRRLVGRAGGLISAAALGAPLLLEACSPAAPTTATSTTRPDATSAPGGVTLPTYMPFSGQVQPDLPGNANGLDPAYFKFPPQLTQTVPQTPGDGSDVSAIEIGRASCRE